MLDDSVSRWELHQSGWGCVDMPPPEGPNSMSMCQETFFGLPPHFPLSPQLYSTHVADLIATKMGPIGGLAGPGWGSKVSRFALKMGAKTLTGHSSTLPACARMKSFAKCTTVCSGTRWGCLVTSAQSLDRSWDPLMRDC